MKIVRLVIVILISTTSLNSNSWADENFDLAVNEFLKGFKACEEANSLRTTDPEFARETFDYYLRQLDAAAAIDPRILKTSEREMSANLAYCRLVENNINRALAAPIMEQALVFCETATNSFDQDDQNQAMHHYDEYVRFKEDALTLSPSIKEIYAFSSRVRSCDRLGQKLDEVVEQQQSELKLVQKAIDEYNLFKKDCEKLRTFVNSKSFGVLKINEANKQLNHAMTHKHKAQGAKRAFKFEQENPTHELSITLAGLVSASKACEADVSTIIRQAMQTRREHRDTLTQAGENLKLSLQECERARDLSEEGDTSALTESIAHYKKSAQLKRQVINSKTPIQYGKLYPNWPEGSRLLKLMSATRQCHTLTAEQIKALKRKARDQQSRLRGEQALQRAANDPGKTENLDEDNSGIR